MTSPADVKLSPTSRIGIIHLLGWMAGVAIVLAFYANFTDWSEIDPEYYFGMRLAHLAFGLCYGTAIAGLGLVLWRRFVDGLAFPTQPGHWLLVLVAATFILVGLTDVTTRGMQWLGWIDRGWDRRAYAQQVQIWFVVFAGSIFAICLGRRLGRWRWLAAAVALLTLANALTSLAAQLVFYSNATTWLPLPSGNWPYFAVHCSRLYGTLLCLPFLLWAGYRDRHDRDWVHWVGICVAIVLGVIEVVQVTIALMYYG